MSNLWLLSWWVETVIIINNTLLYFRNGLYQTTHWRPLIAVRWGQQVQLISSSDDFFSGLQSSKAQDGAKQLDAYLSCSADNMDLLKSFPAVCKLSVKLNTPLPASAACERLFSIAGLVFSPRRARLNAFNFENQLLLRINNRFLTS